MSTSVRGVGWQASCQFHVAGDADKGSMLVEAEAQVAEDDQNVAQRTHGGKEVESRLHGIGNPDGTRRVEVELGLGGRGVVTTPWPMKPTRKRLRLTTNRAAG